MGKPKPLNGEKTGATPRHPRASGHGAVYVKGGDGRIQKSVYLCACHGREFESRLAMRMHIAQYHKMVRTSLAELVQTNGLGQAAWERLPGETPLQYSRFKIYLSSVGPTMKRSCARAADIMGRPPREISRLSTYWHWSLRAELWDRHIEAEELAQFEQDKRRSARRQASVGRKLQDVALAGASALLLDEDRVKEMSGNEIAKLADIGTKIERLANSDPTSITDDRGQVRLVWEGPKPTWAPAPPDHQTIEGGPLTTKVLEAGE